MQERFRFFKRKNTTVKTMVAYTDNTGYQTMDISGLAIAQTSGRPDAPTRSYIYEDGQDNDFELDPIELENITRVEKSIEAKVQEVTKPDKASTRAKGIAAVGKTKIDEGQRNKSKKSSINTTSLITSTGVLAFEGLHDSISIEYDGDENNNNYDENGKPKEEENNMVFVTVSKEQSTGLNLPSFQRYYDQNVNEEEYWIHLR